MTQLSRPLFLLLVTLCSSGCSWERPESFYASLSEARLKGAIEAGWVPPWLPEGATGLRELHDIDTNESMLAFDLDPTRDWQLPDHCQPVAFQELSPPRFSRSWWPSAQQLEKSYLFFRCKGDLPFSAPVTWVGKHKSGQQGLHWRAHAR